MNKLTEAVEKARKLLKEEGELLKQHPELLYRIEQGLSKARPPRDDEDSRDDEQEPEDDFGDGFSVHNGDDEGEGDEADKWLKEAEAKAKQKKEPEVENTPVGDSNPAADAEAEGESEPDAPEVVSSKRKGKSSYGEWKPRDDYAPHHKQKMDEHIANGYSPREAERMSGATPPVRDIMSALKSNTKPSMPSDKMLDRLRPLAQEWLQNADKYERASADPKTNPMKYLAGKLHSSHEARTKDFKESYNGFLNSDEVKNLKGLARHKAIQSWKNKYNEDHPEYNESLSSTSESEQPHNVANEAHGARKAHLNEVLDHILRGGVSMPGEASYQEAAQAVGQEKEDAGHQVDTIKDPAAVFANSDKGKAFIDNKKQTMAAQQEKAAAAQPKKPDPIQVITRRLKPEQHERFKRIESARAAQGVTSKPPTEEE